MARIWEQVDRTGEKLTYSWILDGVKKGHAKHLPGWKWINGRPGSFVTTDPEQVVKASDLIGADVASNGTHEVHGAPGLLCIVGERKSILA